jgi:hypothetical protein
MRDLLEAVASLPLGTHPPPRNLWIGGWLVSDLVRIWQRKIFPNLGHPTSTTHQMEMKDLFEAMTSLLLGKATLMRAGQEVSCPQSWSEYGEERNWLLLSYAKHTQSFYLTSDVCCVQKLRTNLDNYQPNCNCNSSSVEIIGTQGIK